MQPDFSSALLSPNVFEKYIAAANKLRKELKMISLEDHAWSLWVRDQDNVAFVRLWCKECNQEFGDLVVITPSLQSTTYSLTSKKAI